MPVYRSPIDVILFEEDVKLMLTAARDDRDRALVSLMWLTGARPSEIIALKKNDFSWDSEELRIRIKTLKLRGDGQKFKGNPYRVLEFTRPKGLEANLWAETAIRYVTTLPEMESRLFDFSSRWLLGRVNILGQKAIGKSITSYHFRHSVFNWMARNGSSVNELMNWKGSHSANSVLPYFHAMPHMVKLQNQRRDREREQQQQQEDKKEAGV